MMKVTIEVTPKHLWDLWVTFVESGVSSFWCGKATFRNEYDNVRASYQDEKLYERDWSVTLYPAEPDDFKPTKVTAESFANLPAEALRSLANLVNEDSDANDADLIVQGAAFHEIVYG
jgi:hypothetical protein